MVNVGNSWERPFVARREAATFRGRPIAPTFHGSEGVARARLGRSQGALPSSLVRCGDNTPAFVENRFANELGGTRPGVSALGDDAAGFFTRPRSCTPTYRRPVEPCDAAKRGSPVETRRRAPVAQLGSLHGGLVCRGASPFVVSRRPMTAVLMGVTANTTPGVPHAPTRAACGSVFTFTVQTRPPKTSGNRAVSAPPREVVSLERAHSLAAAVSRVARALTGSPGEGLFCRPVQANPPSLRRDSRLPFCRGT